MEWIDSNKIHMNIYNHSFYQDNAFILECCYSNNNFLSMKWIKYLMRYRFWQELINHDSRDVDE